MKRAVRARPTRTEAQRQELLTSGLVRGKERDLLKKVSSRISARDAMYTGDGAHYFSVGLSAIKCIDAARQARELPEPANILDMPCGHGRVLRFLNERFPNAELTACEIDRDGIDFCVREFGATPAYSNADPDTLTFGTKFDLIWCGSLVTHLDHKRIAALLRFFARSLSQTGMVVLSAHGEFVAQRIGGNDFDYMLSAGQVDRLRRDFGEEGFGYQDYEFNSGYGVSLTSREWLTSLAERNALRPMFYGPRMWDMHHDVHGFTLQRAKSSMVP